MVVNNHRVSLRDFVSEALEPGAKNEVSVLFMPQSRSLVRNALFNWTAFACSVGVSLFLSPLIVRHLGNGAYGVWTLINAISSYMSLLDFGLRGTVTRFVAWDLARENLEDAKRTVSTTLWIRLWIGCGVVVVSIGLAFLAPVLFTIPLELHQATRWALIMAGLSVAISLVGGIFGAVLSAFQRYD